MINMICDCCKGPIGSMVGDVLTKVAVHFNDTGDASMEEPISSKFSNGYNLCESCTEKLEERIKAGDL